MDHSPSSNASGMPAAWSGDAYRELVRLGRQFAETVLVHLERLENLSPQSDPRDIEDANIVLESALLDFQDAQVAYCGQGFDFLDDSGPESDPAPDPSGGTVVRAGFGSDEPGFDTGPLEPGFVQEQTRGSYVPASGSTHQPVAPTPAAVISVMTRHDFALHDQAAVEATAQRFATEAGATPVPKGDLGYAMAILNYVGLAQLTTTPGLEPLLEVNAITSRPSSPTAEQISASDGVTMLFETGQVLNYQTNFWSEEQ